MEALFAVDLILCFFQEYKDEETYEVERRCSAIASRYLQKSFVFDFLALTSVPVPLFLNPEAKNFEMYNRLSRLLKLLRLPRLVQLLDVERFRSMLNQYYYQQLREELRSPVQELRTPAPDLLLVSAQEEKLKSFPILRKINMVNCFKMVRQIILIFTISYFLGIFWFIFIRDF